MKMNGPKVSWMKMKCCQKIEDDFFKTKQKQLF